MACFLAICPTRSLFRNSSRSGNGRAELWPSPCLLLGSSLPATPASTPNGQTGRILCSTSHTTFSLPMLTSASVTPLSVLISSFSLSISRQALRNSYPAASSFGSARSRSPSTSSTEHSSVLFSAGCSTASRASPLTPRRSRKDQMNRSGFRSAHPGLSRSAFLCGLRWYTSARRCGRNTWIRSVHG